MIESLGLLQILPSLLTMIFLVLLLYILIRFVDRQVDWGGRAMIKGGIYAFFFLVGIPLVIALLPIEPSLKENVLKVGGLIISAVVAFSSTTVIRDAAAGLALRVMAPFRRGDYLETDRYFGRVSEVGMVHTELQTEDRSLVTLANANLLDGSFKSIPASGTILSTTVSLGYDVPRQKIEKVLLSAAEAVGLDAPFVHVKKLGNFAVTYKIAGLLEEVENLLTEKSNFRKAVLDRLHESNIEIVSPDFVNRRDVSEGAPFIPETEDVSSEQVTADEQGELTEQVIFEKALDAKKAEDLDQLINELKERKEELEEAASDSKPDEQAIAKLEQRISTLEDRRDNLEDQLNNKDDDS